MYELDLQFSMITETWFTNNKNVQNEIDEVESGQNIGLVCKNRKGKRGGGVAIAFNKIKMNLKKYTIPNNTFEMVCAVGNTVEDTRKFAVFVLYIPPSQKSEVTTQMMSCLSDCIEKIKLELSDPYIVIGGDLNRRQLAIPDFPDIQIVGTNGTRNGAALDVIGTNIDGILAEVISPLETEDGRASDHLSIAASARLPRIHHYTKTSFYMRRYTEEAEALFGQKLLEVDWETIKSDSPSKTADNLDAILQRLYTECFPLIKKTVRSCDAPWMTKKIKRAIRNRKRIFLAQGRSELWKKKKEETDALIEEAKKKYFEDVKAKIKDGGNNKGYFIAAKILSCKETPNKWQIQKMFPNLTSIEIAEKAAEFFNAISKEFKPVRSPNKSKRKEPPEMYQISAALKGCKKPKSTVRGDIDKRLVAKFHDILAIPLHAIYSQVYESLEWPALWANETVHLIPKTNAPDSLKQLRNLSCTPLFSKVLESFLLSSLKSSTKLSRNQFGGQKGLGVDHFLVQTWNSILTALEDNRASVQLMSIDFEKAFNRMDHDSCLVALHQLGAKDEDIELVACFLRNRTMQVKIGDTYSAPRTVPGGSPQGSILGNFLFCATSDEFTTTEIATNDTNHAPQIQPVNGVEEAGGEDVEVDEDGDASSFDSDHGEGPNFRFFRPNPRRITDELERSLRMPQAERDAILGIPENWISKPATVMAYIDDLNVIEKIRHSDAVANFSVHKQVTHAHAPQSESFFKQISVRAAELKMRVNEGKTQVLCISSSKSSTVKSYIDGESRVGSGDELKILGFWFGTAPGVGLHIDKTEKKFRQRLWSLRHLKRAGMSTADLIFIYLTILRPVLDFAAPAYHSMLTKEQDD